MSNPQCLYCYQELDTNEWDYHARCSKKMFGTAIPPELPYTAEQMLELAEKIIKSQTTVTGVQPKLSLHIDKLSNKEEVTRKFTIVGLWGDYILKPPTHYYPHLPELEDLTMHLAEIAGIKTVPHSLIRLASGELAYITKRVDRQKKKKLHMEDMCQLTERLTEYKYKGSHEQIGKAIIQYATNPILDIINYFEQVVFSFLTGNADMHLKNFSLLKQPIIGYVLCPAYDMVASSLVVEGDEEELALTLNGKKRKLKKADFQQAMSRFDIDDRAIENIFGRFEKKLNFWSHFIDQSFIPEDIKQNYKALIQERVKQLHL
jgi:serine/threonine-protein kinase HipA